MKLINIYPSEKKKAYVIFIGDNKNEGILSYKKFILKYPEFKVEVDEMIKNRRVEF